MFSENSFVVIQFLTNKKSVKHYIGLITCNFNEECTIRFLRKSGEDIFVFPPTDDISCIEKKDIVLQLKTPILNNRGHYKFVENLSVYKNMG